MSTLQQFNVVERKFAEADLLCIPKPTKYDGKGNANYRARVEIGRNRQTDVPVYKSIYGKTDAEARQKAYDFIRKEIAAQTERSKITGKLSYAIE